MNLNEEHLEQAFARDGNPTCAEDSCGHSVDHEDVLTLKGTSWLNDKVIDLCFWALQQRDSKKLWNLQKQVATQNLFFPCMIHSDADNRHPHGLQKPGNVDKTC